MPSDNDRQTTRVPRTCQWVNLSRALEHFAAYDGPTQSQQHIRPLHWYVTCRLVLEGGFHPDELKPRPPFTVARRRGRYVLHFDPTAATGGEATVLGGLKTKNVDVVINKDGLGPVLAVSCKGMTGAFRNLTNRMEETIGECTNLHIPTRPSCSDTCSSSAPIKGPMPRPGRAHLTGFIQDRTWPPTILQSWRPAVPLKRSSVSTRRWARSPAVMESGRTPVDTRRYRLR